MDFALFSRRSLQLGCVDRSFYQKTNFGEKVKKFIFSSTGKNSNFSKNRIFEILVTKNKIIMNKLKKFPLLRELKIDLNPKGY